MARVLFVITSVAVLFWAQCGPSFPQSENNEVGLTIHMESGTAKEPPAFVFVKGQLAGVAPGIVFLPANELVPIEIGLAQFKFSPLYSFEFGPDIVKSGAVTLISTNYTLDKGIGSVILSPNTTKKITIDALNSNSYSITLPERPRDHGKEIQDFWSVDDKSLRPKETGIPVKTSETYTSSALHLSYKKSVGDVDKTVLLDNPSDWSGARFVEYPGGLFDPYSHGILNPYSISDKWTIISSPEGATIFTADGQQGKTNSTVNITKSLSAFVVLELDGYQQCSEAECDKTEPAAGSIMLRCNLKKAPVKP